MDGCSAAEALRRLREGNQQFVAAVEQGRGIALDVRAEDMTRPQRPFAIILGCSDARVPAELVFHQGLGDLFVIRVAGNVVAPSQIGSVEFAAAQFGVRLVVVLGHTGCGAVSATLATMGQSATSLTHNIHSIVKRIRPSVAGVLEAGCGLSPSALMHAAVRANVMASVAHLQAGSALIEELILKQGLQVVGAEYDLASGFVQFLDGV